MRHDIRVAVALQSRLGLETDPSQHQRPPSLGSTRERVLVEADPDSGAAHRSLHRSAIARSSGEVSLRLWYSPWDHDDPGTESFEETGVVGRLGLAVVRAPQQLGPEGLRRLHRHQLAPVERLDDAAPLGRA